MSHIRFNLENIRWVVVWMAWRTNVLWAVHAYWNGGGLYVEANSLDNPNDWNADNRFLSRNSIFFSRLGLSWRVFCK